MSISIGNESLKNYFLMTEVKNNDKNRIEVQKQSYKHVKSAVKTKSTNNCTVFEQKTVPQISKPSDGNGENISGVKDFNQKNSAPIVYDYPTNPFVPVDLIADFKADMNTMRINEEFKKTEKDVLYKLIG